MSEGDLVLYTAQEVADLLRLNHQVVQRKLQAGEIPGYRIGREWRVEQAKLRDWLEQHSNQRRSDPEAKVLANFFDPEGRLRSIPARRTQRAAVLRRIAEAVRPDRAYNERALNALLRRFHPDVATLRRELVAMKLLIRTKNGVYKRTLPPR
jgi:excisionase family DNA binding protein